MSDIIRLLPDHIANQIAAGEVVQRPASVVKELMENSIDAGATKINLIVKDGGRTLIQIIDNGSGMSAVDARMSFERHATSKISSADDLFKLQTKGFRGEALASIAAIAHVTMKTKLHDAELGTELLVEGSKIVLQEPINAVGGTSIAVKNLFYNVPARRNFLGKDTTEYQKILEEFLRIALVHPEIEFTFIHNGDEVYNLPIAKSLRLRIVGIYGARFNEKLVPVNEETDIVKITGFVTKPEAERSANDRCFFFVNHRYFKDRYYNHAVMTAYEGMLPAGKYPPYFLYLEVPTHSIDVNVHPTKTEVKFEESQFIYQILRSAVKQALGQNNIVSTLDFEQETSFEVPLLKKGEEVKMPEIKVNPEFNPFLTQPNREDKNLSAIHQHGFGKVKPNKADWENFYEITKGQTTEADEEDESDEEEEEVGEITIESSLNEVQPEEKKKPYQINEKYILTTVKNGFMLIDQYRAHCRILFDEMMAKMTSGKVQSQQLLFPEELMIERTERSYWQDLLPTLQSLGFELILASDTLKISAVPTEVKDKNPQRVLTDLMDEYRHSEQTNLTLQERIVAGVASAMAIRGGTRLTTDEMLYLVDALFASSSPMISPKGKKVVETITIDELTKRFN